MTIPNVRSVVVAGLCALAVIGCGGGDDSDATTTTAPPTTTSVPPPSTSAPTTVATTVATTPAPTDPPTTTVPATTVEDVEAQIQADLTAGRERLRALQMQPTLDGLEDALATIALPGSEYYEEELAYVKELVRLGDVVVLGEPPVDTITVEAVTFDDVASLQAASVKVCDAANIGQITPAENSPVGEDIISVEPSLLAVRYSMSVVRSDSGWVIEVGPQRMVDAGFPGQATCEPS